MAGLLPIPEIQYLAYIHNALDQIRGEACSLSFFSSGQSPTRCRALCRGWPIRRASAAIFTTTIQSARCATFPDCCWPRQRAETTPRRCCAG